MGLPVDVVFDYETIGPSPLGIIAELSYVPFIDDPHHPPTFKELISVGRKYKFRLKGQSEFGRIKDADTIGWWKRQSKEAQSILFPTDNDLDLFEGHRQFMRDLEEDGISNRHSFDYCRGPEFDRGLMTNVLRMMTGKNDTRDIAPFSFWNSRDVRTAIENRLMARGCALTPLRKGMLDGFIKHDSIHDCAKDALMLIYATRYAMGIEEPPAKDDVDENSRQ